jgi:hypothetical protein
MNSQEHVIDLIPDFLMGSFDTARREEIQDHLRSCVDCKREFESLGTLWNSLADVHVEKPTPILRERFYAMLAAYEHGMNQANAKSSVFDALNAFIERVWPKQPAIQFAFALALFLVGGVVGTRINLSSEKQSPPDTSIELATLRGEVQAMNRMLAVSLMQQQSASERLRGITLTSHFQQPDRELTGALFEAMNYDPNVNVRLAAIDALQQYGSDPLVRKGIIDALTKQHSPLVQVALIDASVSLRERQSKSVFEEMLKNPKLNVSVKSRMELALKELKDEGLR